MPKSFMAAFTTLAMEASAFSARTPSRPTLSYVATFLYSMSRFQFPLSCKCAGLRSAATNLPATSVAFSSSSNSSSYIDIGYWRTQLFGLLRYANPNGLVLIENCAE